MSIITLVELLWNEIDAVLDDLAERSEDQYIRRNTVRLIFGFADAVSSLLCQAVKMELPHVKAALSRDEKKTVWGNEPNLLDRVTESYSAYAKAKQICFELDVLSENYVAFKNGQAIIDRITRPTAPHHMFISDLEMLHAQKAYRWLCDEYSRLIHVLVTGTLAGELRPKAFDFSLVAAGDVSAYQCN
jgi:hypothetical protein